MIRLLFSVYDCKAEVFTPIVGYLTKAEAIRDFSAMTNNKDNPISRNPEDFSLFHLGSFNPSNGDIQSVPQTQLIRAIDCVDKG